MTRRRLAAHRAGVVLSVLAVVTACVPSQDQDRPRPVTTSSGWTVTVYYTAVEAFHTGGARTVRGCPTIDCAVGDAVLGRYPRSFVRAVQDEGTGRITSGRHAGRYLNWSNDTGYWLDVAPRDSYGRSLRPWVSAAADRDVLPRGHRFRIGDCGRVDAVRASAAAVCRRLREPEWQVRDRFTPGYGGKGHVDVYLGEETGPGFTSAPIFTTLRGATLISVSAP